MSFLYPGRIMALVRTIRMPTFLFVLCYLCVVVGVWILTCVGLAHYLNYQARKAMVLSKIMEWNFRKNIRTHT